MTCDEVLTRLSAFLDGELAPPESAIVQRHLDGCRPCAARFRLLHQTRQAFRGDARRSMALPLGATVILAVTLGLALSAIRQRLNQPYSPAPGMIRPAADVRRPGSSRIPVPMAGLDCGRAGAGTCIVDIPCRDSACAPTAPGMHSPEP